MGQSVGLKLPLSKAIERYPRSVDDRTASANCEFHTRRSFAYALRKFAEVVAGRVKAEVSSLRAGEDDPDWVRQFMDWLKRQRIAPATERLRLVAVQGLYNYLSAESVDCNPARVRTLIQQWASPVKTNEKVLDLEDVETLLRLAQEHVTLPHRSKWEKLRALRDYAFKDSREKMPVFAQHSRLAEGKEKRIRGKVSIRRAHVDDQNLSGLWA